jgi:hypothetical protein
VPHDPAKAGTGQRLAQGLEVVSADLWIGQHKGIGLRKPGIAHPLAGRRKDA